MGFRDRIKETTTNESNHWHEEDNLLRNITYKELMKTVLSNERVIDEDTVRKVFNDLLIMAKNDALEDLKINLKSITQKIKEQRDY